MLSSTRILLRAPEPDDLIHFYTWENDPALWAYGDTLAPFSAAQIKRFIEESAHDLFLEKQLRLVIELKEAKLPVGCLDLFHFNPIHRSAEVGILVADKTYQNQGIASEALQLTNQYATAILNIRNLFAQVSSNNPKGLRLFERNKYVCCGKKSSCLFHDGRWHDVLIFQNALQ